MPRSDAPKPEHGKRGNLERIKEVKAIIERFAKDHGDEPLETTFDLEIAVRLLKSDEGLLRSALEMKAAMMAVNRVEPEYREATYALIAASYIRRYSDDRTKKR